MNLTHIAPRRSALFCSQKLLSPIRIALAAALVVCAGTSFAGADKPKFQRTDWHPASSLISVSERGGIVVAPVAALDGLNEGLSVALQDPSRPALDVALPGPSEVELELNALAIQITTNPSTSLPANAVVTGVEVGLAINAQALNEKGIPLSAAPQGFSVIDAELTIADPGALATTANRAKQLNLNYGGATQFVATRYGGSSDLWGPPGLPSNADFYRNNSLILQIKLRNLSQTPALLRADQFRIRFHYVLTKAATRSKSLADPSLTGLCLQETLQTAARDCAAVQHCYASKARRQVCDLQLSQLLAQICARSATGAACTEQAATILDQTLAQRSWAIPSANLAPDQSM